MPQVQHDIPIYWSLGREGRAARTGNNAAWLCLCGRERPLLGFSDRVDSGSTASLVVCPSCGREYRVVAPSSKGVPTHVQELGAGGSTA